MSIVECLHSFLLQFSCGLFGYLSVSTTEKLTQVATLQSTDRKYITVISDYDFNNRWFAMKDNLFDNGYPACV